MDLLTKKTQEFREKVAALPREEILEILEIQDPEIIQQISRIEWVFENKLQHLTWTDGTPVMGRPLTNFELALLVDEPFEPIQELTDIGLSIRQQREVHVAKDAVTWGREFLGVYPRVYQTLIIRHPSLRKVLRAGRRLGKTHAMALILLHYAWTTQNGRAIIVTPVADQATLIYKQIDEFIEASNLVKDSVERNVRSPRPQITFKNGAWITFFTSGTKSGGKSDATRGQEAHLIVLDELDYMNSEDLDALYAMLQKTDDNQPDKIMIGASTPTGRQEVFWEYCTNPKFGFKEFWFPSYCNPYWDGALEQEMRMLNTENVYRHEFEADWGDASDGVYPRKFVSLAFVDEEDDPNFTYKPRPSGEKSFYVMGVDWDKYGAGTNIVILEVCGPEYRNPRYAGKVKLCYREEVNRDSYTLTRAVQRIIELDAIFRCRHIYVDRGFGEVQVELLRQHGVKNPGTGFEVKVKGINFRENIEVRDPYNKQKMKKEAKPFMVDNLRSMFEQQRILIPGSDGELFKDLIGYVVARTSALGAPVFESSGTSKDHIHDALILACLAVTQNYGELMQVDYPTKAYVVSNETFMPTFQLSADPSIRSQEIEMAEDKWGSLSNSPIQVRRNMTYNRRRGTRPFSRKMF